MSLVGSCLLAFLVGAIYDLINVRFIAATAQRRALAAATYSMMVGGCALAGVVEAVHRPVSIPFLLAGYWVGTYIAVRRTP